MGGKFKILGGDGGGKGGQIPSRHIMMSHRRHFDVMCPLGF